MEQRGMLFASASAFTCLRGAGNFLRLYRFTKRVMRPGLLLLLSLLPALRGSRVDLGLALKQREPAFSIRRRNLRTGFVALQLELSIVLFSLGLLFARNFVHLANADPGFQHQRHGDCPCSSAPGARARAKRGGPGAIASPRSSNRCRVLPVSRRSAHCH